MSGPIFPAEPPGQELMLPGARGSMSAVKGGTWRAAWAALLEKVVEGPSGEKHQIAKLCRLRPCWGLLGLTGTHQPHPPSKNKHPDSLKPRHKDFWKDHSQRTVWLLMSTAVKLSKQSETDHGKQLQNQPFKATEKWMKKLWWEKSFPVQKKTNENWKILALKNVAIKNQKES